MKYAITNAIVLSLALLMSACGPFERKASLNPTFGNAVRHNMNVQIVNPDAGAKPTEPSDQDGNRARDAYKRYSTGAVEEPKEVKAGGAGGSSK
jgi:hypothetical protein